MDHMEGDSFTGKPLDLNVYPCYQELPPNRTLDGYVNLTDSNCNFCREKCQKLDVTSDIGFFDGFRVTESVWFIASVAAFSILY